MQPGPRDAQKTLDQLIEILDNSEIYGAIAELLERDKPKLALAQT
jgi:hypothetical protein